MVRSGTREVKVYGLEKKISPHVLQLLNIPSQREILHISGDNEHDKVEIKVEINWIYTLRDSS